MIHSTWRCVRPGYQLDIRGARWRVLDRDGDLFELHAPSLKVTRTGRMRLDRSVVILEPGDRLYVAGRRELAHLALGPEAQWVAAVELVTELLGGVELAPLAGS